MMSIVNRKKIAISAILAGSFWFSQIGFAAPMELTLDKAIDMALASEPRVFIADSSISTAKANRRIARAGGGVTVDYDYTFKKTGQTKPSIADSIENSNSNLLTAKLPIYTGGAVSGNIDKSEKAMLASEYSYDKVLQEVLLDTTNNYYKVLQARNTVKLTKESVERLQAHLTNVQAQFSVGTVAKVDVLRSEVELADAEQELIKAKNDYDLAVANLNNIIGNPLDTEISLQEELEYKPYTESLENCLAYALEHRPDIHAAKLNVDAANDAVKVASADYLPKVYLNATNSWTGENFPGNDKSTWMVGASMNLNVFDSGITSGNVNKAKAELFKQQELERQLVLTVNLAVKSAYLNLREAEKRIGTAKVAVVKAEEDYKIAQVRYSAGVGTNIDVMDSQVALTKAKNNYIQALYSYNTSKSSLDEAIGLATGKEIAKDPIKKQQKAIAKG